MEILDFTTKYNVLSLFGSKMEFLFIIFPLLGEKELIKRRFFCKFLQIEKKYFKVLKGKKFDYLII